MKRVRITHSTYHSTSKLGAIFILGEEGCGQTVGPEALCRAPPPPRAIVAPFSPMRSASGIMDAHKAYFTQNTP